MKRATRQMTVNRLIGLLIKQPSDALVCVNNIVLDAGAEVAWGNITSAETVVFHEDHGQDQYDYQHVQGKRHRRQMVLLS